MCMVLKEHDKLLMTIHVLGALMHSRYYTLIVTILILIVIVTVLVTKFNYYFERSKKENIKGLSF